MAEPEMTVRRLAANELTGMRALNALFADVFEDEAAYAHQRPDDRYLRDWLSNPNHFAIVAFEHEKLVGGLAAYRLQKFEQARSEIYIYDLGVKLTHRRRGIATALINVLKNIAAGLDAWVIYVQADHGDEPAIALYESLGEREEVLHFDIPVGTKRARPAEG